MMGFWIRPPRVTEVTRKRRWFANPRFLWETVCVIARPGVPFSYDELVRRAPASVDGFIPP